MKINYYPDTDLIYIDLSAKTKSKSTEISEGVVLDNDENGKIVWIDKIMQLTN